MDPYIFEQPLTERFRLILRIEHLFARIDHHLAGSGIWDTHAALRGLLELRQTTARGDSRQALIKELDRQRVPLSEQYDGATTAHEELIARLHSEAGGLSEGLRGNALLEQLQQRAAAGAQPSALDLPSYQQWMQRSAESRHASVRAWLSPLLPAREAVEQALASVRAVGEWQNFVAPDGYFEQTLARGHPPQLLRLYLPQVDAADDRFPEISAGRQRFTIRFFRQSDPAERSEQLDADIDFQLAHCAIH